MSGSRPTETRSRSGVCTSSASSAWSPATELAEFEAALTERPGTADPTLDALERELDGGWDPGHGRDQSGMRDAARSSNGRDAAPDFTARTGGPSDGVEPGSGRVVAVWGPTGAPGRTTIAVTLATELAALGIPTVLVDADTYGGSVAALSFLDEAPGIAAATRAADQGTLDLPTLARLAPVATAGSGCSPAYPRRSGGRRSGRPPWNGSSPSAGPWARS